MIGSGPLNFENITDLLEELDSELDRAGGRAEVYLAGGARMLFGWRADRRTSDLDGVMRTGQNLLMTSVMKMSRKRGLEATWVNRARDRDIAAGAHLHPRGRTVTAAEESARQLGRWSFRCRAR